MAARQVACIDDQADDTAGQEDRDAGDLECVLSDIQDLLELHVARSSHTRTLGDRTQEARRR